MHFPPDSPWAKDEGKPMHSGAHAERFTDARAKLAQRV